MRIHKRLLLAGILTILLMLFTPVADAAQGKNFLWEIGLKQNKIFILGSIHLARPDIYPLNPMIEQVYNQTDILAVEADINNVNMPALQNWLLANGMYASGDGLTNHISPKTKDKLQEMKVDLSLIGRMKPWLAAVTLQAEKLKELGFDESNGIDRYFLQAAQGKKPIKEIEGMDYQLQLFEKLSAVDQDLFLYFTLVDLAQTGTKADELIKAWRIGDVPGFEKAFFQGTADHPELKPFLEKILYERNQHMLSAIETFLKSGSSHLVVVGAGHLIGPKGLIQRLKAKGFRVKQL